MAAAATVCQAHADQQARWECRPCRAWLCGGCVKMLGDGRTAQCVTCGGLAVPLAAAPGARGPSASVRGPAPAIIAHDPLMKRLQTTASFLRQPSTLMALGVIAVLDWLSTFMRGSAFIGPVMTAGWVILGLKAALYFRIVSQTANDNDELDFPEISLFVEDVLEPGLRYVLAGLPLVIALFWGDVSLLMVLLAPKVVLQMPMGPTVMLLAWVLLWPLMTCIAAIGRRILPMYDPRTWIDTIRTMGSDYVVGVVTFYAVLAFEVLVWIPLLIDLSVKVEFPMLGLVWAFLALIPWALRARVLGEMCKPYQS